MIIDIVFCIFLIILVIRGFSRGILYSVFSLLGLLIAIMVSVNFSRMISVVISHWFGFNSKYLPLLSFIVVFIAVYFVFRLLEKSLEHVFRALRINFINKLAGALVWALIWTLLFSTLLFYANNMDLLPDAQKRDSIVYRETADLAPQVVEGIGRIIPPVRNIFDNLEEWFHKINYASDEGEPA